MSFSSDLVERLDRWMVNSIFLNIFSMVIEKYIIKNSSDHLHILFNLFRIKGQSKAKLFRFEHIWLSHNSCKMVVENGWGDSPCVTMGDSIRKIRSCSDALSTWNKTDFGHV